LADGELRWFVDIFSHFRDRLHVSGWLFHTGHAVVELGTMFPDDVYSKVHRHPIDSSDVVGQHGRAARGSRFEFVREVRDADDAMEMRLIVTLADGQRLELTRLATPKMSQDPYHALQSRFFAMLHQRDRGSLLEIGSRNRSGNVRKSLLPPHMSYVGMDIAEGGNVDIVGDAHQLSEIFPAGQFDAILSMSVFEHLIMPWKVALEMNRVMKPGALALITTHQTFPMHELPWDFWRFSDRAWRGLFNEATGFKILDTGLGERASVVADLLHPVTARMDLQPAYLGSAVLCEKIAETSLQWPVKTRSILSDMYPD
jgi:hypothetical protein